MKKRQNLASLLAIPIIAILGGCVHSDQIRIPDFSMMNYKCEINGEKFYLYSNQFKNSLSGSDVLEIKRKDGSKMTYIGFFIKGRLDYIEVGGLFGKRYVIKNLTPKARQQAQEQYRDYLDKVFAHKEKTELEMLEQNSKPF